MIVPFSAADFLNRALAVYGERTGIVDEPDQPAESLGDVSYARLGELARAQAAKLDELGIGVGDSGFQADWLVVDYQPLAEERRLSMKLCFCRQNRKALWVFCKFESCLLVEIRGGLGSAV